MNAEYNAAVFICEIIQRAGHQAVFAGGCVRDMLLNKPYADIDIATSCPENELINLLVSNEINTKSVGKAFGVTLAQIGDCQFEIARFRKDINCDGRHPEEVRFCSMEEDAQRRDFTINAVFYDPVADKYHDFVGGIEDIKNKRLRFVGSLAERLAEDYLRVLRYVRFCAKGFKPNKSDQKLIDRSFADDLITHVSPERIRMELMDKLFPVIKDTKVFEEFPNLFDHIFNFYPCQLMKVNQSPKWHPEGDVWTHTLKTVGWMLSKKHQTSLPPTPLLILAMLLHDFGKLTTTILKPEDNDWHSFGHEKDSADFVKAWMTKYKFSNDEIEFVHWLVLNHMKLHYPGLKKSTLKRMIIEGNMPYLQIMTLCDCMGACGDVSEYLVYEEKIHKIMNEGVEIKPKPILTGNDLIASGLKPGPLFGIILNKAYDHQLEDSNVTREMLLQEALENASRT